MAINSFLVILTVCMAMVTVVQLVGIATPNWFVLDVNSTNVHAGLFQVCVGGTVHLCIPYSSYVGLNGK